VAEPELADVTEADLRDYGAVSRWSVAAVGLGIISFLALFSPLLLLLPALGVFAARRAIQEIRESEHALIGRKAALTGLALSVMFFSAVPAQYAASRVILVRQADAFARQWFEMLRDRQPLKAHHLEIEPPVRLPASRFAQLPSHYRSKEGGRDEIKFFVAEPLVRALLELGPKAQVRFYSNEAFVQEGKRQRVTNVYAVTYPADKQKKTFFVRLELERTGNSDSAENWRVASYRGGVHPL